MGDNNNDQTLLGAADPPPAEPAPAPAAPPAPPESYTPFTVPEGESAIEDSTHAELSDMGRRLGLNQDQMQELVDYGYARLKGDGMEAVRLHIAAEHEKWRKEADDDPEIRRDINHARRAVERFGGDSFRQVLEDTGMGNHPAFIRFCIAAGRALGEAPFVSGEKPGASSRETLSGLASAVYPNFK